MVNRSARSTSVPIALPLAVPQIRSPSQCLGTARSSISAGRARIAVRLASGASRAQCVFQVEFGFAFGLHVDGPVDGLGACLHAFIIPEFASEPAADPFVAQTPGQPVSHVLEQSRIRRDSARLGAFEQFMSQLARQIRLVPAVGGIRVAPDLAADARRASTQTSGDRADRLAGAQAIGHRDAFGLAQVPRADGSGLVHTMPIPVRRRVLVPSRAPGATVAPYLARALGHPGRAGPLGEVQSPVQQFDIAGASHRAHQAPRGIDNPPVLVIRHPFLPERTGVATTTKARLVAGSLQPQNPQPHPHRRIAVHHTLQHEESDDYS